MIMALSNNGYSDYMPQLNDNIILHFCYFNRSWQSVWEKLRIRKKLYNFNLDKFLMK